MSRSPSCWRTSPRASCDAVLPDTRVRLRSGAARDRIAGQRVRGADDRLVRARAAAPRLLLADAALRRGDRIGDPVCISQHSGTHVREHVRGRRLRRLAQLSDLPYGDVDAGLLARLPCRAWIVPRRNLRAGHVRAPGHDGHDLRERFSDSLSWAAAHVAVAIRYGAAG